METVFRLRKKNKKESYIQLEFNFQGERIRFSTPYVIDSRNWSTGYPFKINTTKALRNSLDVLAMKCNNFIDDMIKKESRLPSKNELREFCKIATGKKKQKTNSLESFCNDYFNYKQTRTKEKRLEIIKSVINNFSISCGKIDLNQLIKNNLHDWQNSLTNKGLKNSTVNGYTGIVSSFFKWMLKNDYTDKNYSKYFDKLKVIDSEIIALEEKELVILETSTGLSAKLEKTKDLFLFCFYTGLRFSDTKKVDLSAIQNNELMTRQKKTGNFVTIPLLKEAKAILNKYKGKAPHIHQSSLTTYVRELFTQLEMNRLVLQTELINNEIIDTYKPLCEVITNHVSRKSFVTIALSRGIPKKIVMKLSGHKSDSAFNRYVNFSDDTLAEEMQKMNRSARALKKVI